jgi:hypothetical protein
LFAPKTNTNTLTPTANFFGEGSDDFVQAKLNVGTPGDKYEIEADKAADQIVARDQQSSSFIPPSPTIQRQTEEDVQKREAENKIQQTPVVETITPGVQLKPVVQLQAEEEVQTKEEKEEVEEVQQKPVVDPIAPGVQLKPLAQLQTDEDVQTKEDEEIQEKEEEVIQEKCAECEKEEVQKKEEETSSEDIIQTKEGSIFPPIPDAVTEDEEGKEEVPQGETKEEKPLKEEATKEAKGKELPQTIDLPEKQPTEKKEEPPIQMKKADALQKSGNDNANGSIENRLQSSKGKGSAMDSKVQSEMGSGFGADFSNVRIHTNSQAVQMNKDLGAHAFTHGNDIYFNQGKYNPGTESGKHLLAHELTHTIQQGASSNTVQRYTPTTPKKPAPQGNPERPSDGAEVKGKSNNKIDNDDRVKNQGDLSDEEKNEKKDPPRGELRSEKGTVLAEGTTKPSVDRGAAAQEKTTEQKQQMNDQLAEEGPKAEEKEGEKEGEQPSNMAQADAAKQKAEQAKQKAVAVQIPTTPQPFKHPRIEGPKDSTGKDLPRKANIDTQVRGLGYIAEMLREKGYEMKKHAAEKEIHSYGLDASVETSRMDLALAKEGTKKTEEHNTERKEISEKSKKALEESKQRQQFVAQEAPALAKEADKGKGDSAALAGDAKSKADKSKSEIPDDPDAKADAKKQSAEMGQTADGAKSMDDAITQTGERARQYIQDAQKASEDNQQSQDGITENDSIVAQLDGRIAEIQSKNEKSQASIDKSATGPQQIRQHSKRTARSGNELIAATMVMETELNALQEEYLSGMAAIESKEAAEKRIKEEQTKKQKSGVSKEEKMVFELAATPEKDQEAKVATYTPEQRQGMMGALDKMISETPDDGTQATEGKRWEVKLSSGDNAPKDPRQPEIDKVDKKRIERVGGVLDIADQNMNFLSAQQQQMLAEKLVAESITDDIKNINVMQMGKAMLEGMVNPVMALQGVVGGFEKTFSGAANLFNMEAWEKDPLGNLLQSAADISTGLAMIFSSILGVAAMITALMVVLTIISWGTLSPVTGPVIGWMGTVMTYAGWGAIVSGLLSVYLNSLAYIKNLSDAGTATTARELFGNTEQMKKNTTDGFQGAMAVVEGIGAVKMGPALSSGKFMAELPKSPGAFARQTIDGAKDGLSALAAAPGRLAAGAKKLFTGGKQGLINFKDKIKGYFGKSTGKGDVDLNTTSGKKQQQQTLDQSKSKKSDELTPNETRAETQSATTSNTKKVDPNSPYAKDYDVEIEVNGHTYRRKKNGKGWCRFSDKASACDIKLSAEDIARLDNLKTKLEGDIGKVRKRDRQGKQDLYDEINRRDNGLTDAERLELLEHLDKNIGGPKGSSKRYKFDGDNPKDWVTDARAAKFADEMEMGVNPPVKNSHLQSVYKEIKDLPEADFNALKKHYKENLKKDYPKKATDHSETVRKLADDDFQFNKKTKRFTTSEERVDFWTEDRIKDLERPGGGKVKIEEGSPQHKALLERKQAVEKKIADLEAKHKKLGEDSQRLARGEDPIHSKTPEELAELDKFHKQREKSFEKNHPKEELETKAKKEFDKKVKDGEIQDTPENRQAHYDTFEKRVKQEHAKDFEQAKTNANKGDIFEDSAVGPGHIKRKPSDKLDITVDGKKMKVSPDIEVLGPTKPGYVEMKSGSLTLDAKTKDQILRYAALDKNVTYELLGGASQNVKDFLTKHGIQYIDFTNIL